MKKLFIISACLFGLFACQRMEENLELKVVEFEVTDVPVDGTRSSYDPNTNSTVWESGDKIGCFTELCSNVIFTNRDDSPSIFSGSLLGDPKILYFYFPHALGATANGSVVTSTISSAQRFVVDGYSTNPPMVAQSEDLESGVRFINTCGLLKFTVKSDVSRKLVKATFSGNANEAVAGTYEVDMASTAPSLKITADQQTSVVMEAGIDMEAEREYSFIIVLPPTTFSAGFTIKLSDEANNTVTKTFDKSLELKRNAAVNVSTVIEFTEENAVAETVLEMTSLKINDPSLTFEIDQETLVATAKKTGFVNPSELTMALEYTASVQGKSITPTIKLEQDGALEGSEITRPSSFTANLTLPRTISLTYGDVTKTYVVKLSQLTDTGLPVVYVNTPNAQNVTSKDNWLPAEPDEDQADEYYSYIYIDADGRKSWDGVAFEELASAKCYVKGRGNTTWGWDKKPYAIKLDKKSAVLGMAKHKRWVLLANKIDKSMIRNKVTFMIAAACYNDGSGGQQGWNPTGHSVELVLNGQHLGNYLLCEQIKIDNKRINIAESETPQSSTSDQGYLLEGDRYWGDDPTETLYWESYRKQTSYAQLYNRNYTYMYGTNYYDGGAQATSGNYKFKWGLKGPDDGDLGSDAAGKATAAYKFINGKVTSVEEFIFDEMTSSTPLSTIAQYIHVDSFINYWLVFEMAMNQELNNPGSVYMYYDNNDGLMHAGPVWDFDWGTFNYDFTDDGLYNDKSNHFIAANSLWYCRLLQNTAFQNRVLERWTVIKPLLVTLTGKIPTLSEYLSVSAGYNWDMWTTTTSDHGDPNSEKNMTYSNATKRISDNATQRISDLNVLISNKRYK